MREPHTLPLESEAGFKALLEYATVGILVINSEGNIEFANSRIQKLFNYTNAELLGQPVEMLMPKAFRKNTAQHREVYFSEPQAQPAGYCSGLFARKKGGSEFPVEIGLWHYELFSEKLAVAFVVDMTDRKRYHEELETKLQECTLELAESREREKIIHEMSSRFISVAYREFRSPLTAILASVSFVEAFSAKEQEEKRKKHIKRIKSLVKNLSNVLNDLIFLDTLEQGKMEITKSAFNLPAFARDLVKEIHTLRKEELHIHFSHTGEKTIVQDKKIVRNLFLHLLSSAVKYSGEDKEIDFLIEVSNNMVSVQVNNCKAGIPAEEHRQMSGKFSKTKNTTHVQSEGLALNIVKRYVALLGGTSSFKGKPDWETACMIEFPQK